MNTKIILSAFAVLATAASSIAQTAPAATSAGLLGQRYVGASVITEDFRNAGGLDNAFGGGVTANLPLTANLDLGLAYGYERLSDVVKLREHTIGATITPYVNVAENVKLFADGTVGYAWSKVRSGGFNTSNNDGTWAVGAGAEFALGARTALTGRVAYNDLFDSGSNDALTYTAGVNHWFTEKLGGLAAVTFVEDDSVIYQVGVAFRF